MSFGVAETGSFTLAILPIWSGGYESTGPDNVTQQLAWIIRNTFFMKHFVPKMMLNDARYILRQLKVRKHCD